MDYLQKKEHNELRYGRKSASQSVDYIGHRDKWTCHICKKPVSKAPYENTNPLSKTVDHVIPIADGGTDDPANLLLAHMICNAKRGARGGNEQLALIG